MASWMACWAPVLPAHPNNYTMSIRLSLAVAASRTSASELERFLDSLSDAGLTPEDEVCIASVPGEGCSALDLRKHVPSSGGVSLALYPPDSTPMRLWGWAMAQARGAHIAVLDVRDVPVRGWADAWSSAPADHIVCGPVDPGPLRESCSWAAYFSEYGQFLSPLDPERLEEVPGNNVVFPRAFLPSSDTLARKGFWKTLHLERIRLEKGRVPIFVANGMGVVLRHHYELRPYLSRRFLQGRCYAGSRLQEPGAPPRIACIGFTPLLPALRTYRVIRRMRAKPSGTGQLGRALPALLFGETAWSLGELVGYTLGKGGACERLW